MGVVKQELEKIELSIGEHCLLALVSQYPTIWVKPQALQFPDPLVPKVETFVIPSHLGLDEGDVDVSCLLSHRVQLGQLPLYSIQETQFEADEVVVDAHPMTRVLPVLGLDVLSFEGAVGRCWFGTFRHLTTIRSLDLSWLLLKFLRRSVYHGSMSPDDAAQERPDIVAATRGGDNSLGMDDEADPATATLEQALFWRNIYTEILAMEESVLARIHQLMASQTAEARREVELTNVPVVVSQVARFRARQGIWDSLVHTYQDKSGPALRAVPS
jgi:hypothetical protein